MQSFKQFLKEKQEGSVSFVIDFECDGIEHNRLQLFETGIKSELPNYDIEIEVQGINIIISIKNLNSNNGSQQQLEKVNDQISMLIYKILDKDIFVDNYLICYGYPPYKLEWRYIYITCLKEQSISNIDKFIDLNETLAFRDCQNIDGGVLSLLKIKDGAIYLSASSKTPKWIPIVKKYLHHFKPDILACQDELIENGLKEYAKF